MSVSKRTRPLSTIVLIVVTAFLTLSGMFGGMMLVLDPSGKLLGLPSRVLDNTTFTTFIIPGLILLFVLGVFPAIISFALWTRPEWKAVNGLEHIFSEHWGWIGAGVVAVALFVWLAVELWMVGYSSLLLVYIINGVAVIALTLLPSTRHYYRV